MRQTVLVVNDRWNIRKLACLALESRGFQVREAEHGQAALSCLENHAIDLILTDWSMPVMGGREFLEQLRQRFNERKVPVVVFSSSICPEDIQDPNALGIDCWLVAPCRISTIQRVTAELLSGRSMAEDPRFVQALNR